MKEILYFDDFSGKRIEFDEPPQILGFNWQRRKIPETLFFEALKIFKRDIQIFKSKPLGPGWVRSDKDSFINYKQGFWLLTKLTHLYNVLETEGRFNQPFIISLTKRDGKLCGGHGRTLIGYRYFPDIVHEYSIHDKKYGIGGEEIVRKYIESAAHGDDLDKEYAISLIPSQGAWQIKSVNFLTKEYLEERFKRPVTRQLDPFLENICYLDDWKEIKGKILNADLKSDDDYLELLDFMVKNEPDIS